MAYSNRLDAGVYNLHYLVRAVTPGAFFWPGTDVHLQYAPKIWTIYNGSVEGSVSVENYGYIDTARSHLIANQRTEEVKLF